MPAHRFWVGGWILLWGTLVGIGGLPVSLAQQGPVLLPPGQHALPAVPPAVQLFVPRGGIAEPADALQELLRRGAQLETEGRWGDALFHYEEALRSYPTDPTLQRRYELARLHYDLVRRYSDRSFLRLLETLSPQEALGLYNEVLAKIQAHYVDTFRWKDFLERGTADLEIALTQPTFVNRYLAGIPPSKLAEFRETLRNLMVQQEVSSRTAVWQTVRTVAEQASQQLALPPTVVILECLCGVTNSLDPYSAFLTPNQLEEIYSQIEGHFVGLGVELKAEGGRLRIVRVVPGSPAQEGGLRPGDWVLAVGSQSLVGLTTEQAADLLQGPEGSLAELTVQTPGQPPRQLQLRRRRVELPSIEQTRIADPHMGIAYIKLTCFQKTTARDLEAALWDLYRQGMRSLIIDVRGNPGGLLSTAVEVADKFIDHGVIVSTRGRSPQEDFTYTAHQAGTWRVPLVVLVDQESASAAEIFASAIRDHRRGILVGQRTYGKGSVQGIFPLGYAGTGIRLTTARFYSPSGQSFNRIGIEPDILVHRTARIPPDDGAGGRMPQAGLPALSAASPGWLPAGTRKTDSAVPAPVLPGPARSAESSATTNASADEDPALAAALQVARQFLLGRR
ncbi:MAG: S41 family peptidase [Thermoguttaceae bacterium]|nr:S41 family peptidase [Thermoguttaceae bacterium]MDW8038284.1 S41 family peptidase [Thermoguttaceae bacterium]